MSATFAAFVTGAGIIALMSFLSTVLESGTSRPAVAAAAILLAWSGVSVGSALLARRIPLRFSGAARSAGGLLTIAAGLALLALLTTGTTVGQLVAGLLVAGAGTGLVNATLAREAVASVPRPTRVPEAGSTTPAATSVRRSGSPPSRPWRVRPDSAAAGLIAGWNAAVLIGIALCVVGAVVVLALRRAEDAWSAASPAGSPPRAG